MTSFDPKNTELIETIWNESLFGMAIVDREGVILDANPKLCEILGYTRSGLTGKNFRDITHPDDYDMDASEFTRLLSGEIDKYGMFKRYITKSGEIVGLKLKVVAVRKDGTVELILGQVSEALKIVPLDDKQLKRAASVTLGKFIMEHWREVGFFLLVVLTGTKIPEIISLFIK